MEDNGNICKDQSEFDGTYGLAVYNRTEQEKLEDEDSTFIEPKFAQVHTDKPIDEWIVSIAIYCSDNNMVLLDRKKFEKMCEIWVQKLCI